MKYFRKQSVEKELTFQWWSSAQGIMFSCFSAQKAGKKITEYISFIADDDYEAQAQWLLLKDLLDNGQAQLSKNDILIPCEEACNIEVVDQQLLGLPERYPFGIEIRSNGTLNQTSFRYNYRFLATDGKSLSPERKGCVLSLTSDWNYILTKDQYSLIVALDEFNSRSEEQKNYPGNLLEFSSIKNLAKKTGASLEQYLNKENVIAPQKIRLRLRESGDQIEIIPEITDVENELFEPSFDKYPDAEAIYDIQLSDGGRKRVLFDEQQQEALRSVKANRRVSHQDLAKIAEHPQDYFDPDVVDLDGSDEYPSFSDRVIEIGIYHPRVYPFISPYKSQWVPGILVEDLRGQRTKIHVTSKAELDQLKEKLAKAKQDGSEEIEWKGETLLTEKLDSIIPIIEKQLADPKTPVQSEKDPVLIIKENIEEPEYGDKTPEAKEFQHLLEEPANFKSDVRLLSHQKEGVAWLQGLWRERYPGGLLADDMGVGKTLQVLSFLEWHHAQQPNKRPYLIVAPIALLENWQAEHKKFFDESGIKFSTLYGPTLKNFKKPFSDVNELELPNISGSDKLLSLRKRRGSLDISKLQDTGLVLTTYETVRDFQLDMGVVNWAVVVADEAQKIKTPGALVTNALKALKTDFRVVMTGTPVENTLVDLWCITDFVAPGHLGSAKEFAEEFQSPLKDEMTNIKALGENVRNRLGILFKRRLKGDVLEGLPEKHIHDSDCQVQMPVKQEETYANTLRLMNLDSSESNGSKMLKILHQLKFISDHPMLIDSQTALLSAEDLVSQSAKLQATVNILKSVQQKGEKAILFTELRKTQQMLARTVRDLFGLDEVAIVNGDTPGSVRNEKSMKLSRQQTIDRFQAKPGFNVIVISPLAAGVGLNITEANHVIHFTRWWNPAREDQASDRVYRIGQKRPVHIYLPMAVCSKFRTFDLILHDLINRKRSLSEGALFPTERIEIERLEIIQALREQPGQEVESTILTIENVDLLEAAAFESLIAALYKKQGFRVILTPFMSDKGVDVVVLPKKEGENGIIIQVKHSHLSRRPRKEAVNEVVTARLWFQQKYSLAFNMAVVTNTEFARSARSLGTVNGVEFYERSWLRKQLRKQGVTQTDINLCELERDRTV